MNNMKQNEIKFVNIGFGNAVNSDKVISVLSPDSLPAKRLINDARDNGKLLDATCGRKTRAILVTESGQVVLCGLHTDTIVMRLNHLESDKDDAEENA